MTVVFAPCEASRSHQISSWFPDFQFWGKSPCDFINSIEFETKFIDIIFTKHRWASIQMHFSTFKICILLRKIGVFPSMIIFFLFFHTKLRRDTMRHVRLEYSYFIGFNVTFATSILWHPPKIDYKLDFEKLKQSIFDDTSRHFRRGTDSSSEFRPPEKKKT